MDGEPASVPFWLVWVALGIMGGEATIIVWFFQKMKEVREEGAAALALAVKGIEEQIAGVTSLANLALNQLPELRAEMSEKFVSKEGFREAISNLSQTVRTGFDHLTEVSQLNFRRLEERISDLQRNSEAVEDRANPTRPRTTR